MREKLFTPARESLKHDRMVGDCQNYGAPAAQHLALSLI